MKIREVFQKDPVEHHLKNEGVVEVEDPQSQEEESTLRYELQTFVCEGQYERGLDRILTTFLSKLSEDKQPGVWVSGFYGSGKSHLVKMLRFLWADYKFSDGATARGSANLPPSIKENLKELSTAGKRHGGLHAAGGKLGGGKGDSVRLALLRIIFKSRGLPGNYPAARLVMFLEKNGYLQTVQEEVEKAGKTLRGELNDMYVSPVLAEAILKADPDFASDPAEAKKQIREQFPREDDISDEEMVQAIEDALARDGELPLTLVVMDEVQQYIGEDSDRVYRIQEVAEACAARFGARLLFVGTGQNAITGTPRLEKLQARFPRPIQLTDQDVDKVVRKIVLAKKADKKGEVEGILEEYSGEISKHLRNTKLRPRPEDNDHMVADYPLLPTRRRFWEHAMRAVDPAGTKAELRNQLMNVFEAVKTIADEELGHVAPADLIYDQNKAQMVATGVLPKEIHEFIAGLEDGTEEGRLKARICALTFIIGELPREGGADQGIRANADTLADLLVEDLTEGSASLRRKIPPLLEDLVEEGHLIHVEDEYRIQTRESAEWEREFRDCYKRYINDEARIANERSQLLSDEVEGQLKGIRPAQGKSKATRRVELQFGGSQPADDGPDVPVWIRDGWNEQEESIQADSQAAGPSSPLITVFLPRHEADELKKTVASALAANETLNTMGHPSTPEGKEARKAMETRLEMKKTTQSSIIQNILHRGKVYIAGGSEVSGSDLRAKVENACSDALKRLYPEFKDGDHARWRNALDRARNGAANALEAVDHNADPETHPVAKEVLRFIGSGKKGTQIRNEFAAPPYGWPQDAIDAVLATLVVTGHIRAKRDRRTLSHDDLDQRSIGATEFTIESVTVKPEQRIGVRKLFTEADVDFENGQEDVAAPRLVRRLKELASEAGGPPPAPEPPAPEILSELEKKEGNELLVALYEQREEIKGHIKSWKQDHKLLEQRKPRWETLNELLGHSESLAVAEEVTAQRDALEEDRNLLENPDPVEPLINELVDALRQELKSAQEEVSEAHQAGLDALNETEAWQELDEPDQHEILAMQGISQVPEVRVGSEEEVLASLSTRPLDGWSTFRDALPQRFENAKNEAARRIKPEAVSIKLPSATIETEEELEAWLAEVEERIREQLDDSPVII